MKRLFTFFILTICVLAFSGCGDSEPPNLRAAKLAPQPLCLNFQLHKTNPPFQLNIPAGTHFLRYYDEDTSDYMDYYLFVPDTVFEAMPLIIFLHGDGEVGHPELLEDYGIRAQSRSIYGDSFPFILVSPCTRVHSWISGSIPDTLLGLIRSLVVECKIDPDRIIITGHSRGAIGVWHMISNYASEFAGAVPVSCGAESPMNYAQCTQVPVYAFAGNRGAKEYAFMLSMQYYADRINKAGGVAVLNVLEEADHSDTALMAFSKETFEWILSQKRSK